MSHVTAVAVTVLSAAAVAAGVMCALLRPLHLVLWELCVLEHRARFWMRACMIELAVGIGLAATLASAMPSPHAVIAVSRIVQATLFGAIVGVFAIMLVVAREARRFDGPGPPACA